MKNLFMSVMTVLALATVFPASYAGDRVAGDGISSISFDQVPPGTSFLADSISLDGEVTVSQGVSATGVIESSSGGFRFPDGTMQLTAASTSGGSTTANDGLYDNKIPDFSPPLSYTEICFKGGSILVDIHAIGEPTAGGSCVPGDVGWVIERDERLAASWEVARAECLVAGMRLPEPFEYKLSCVDAATYGLNDMVGAWEWASNSAMVVSDINKGVAAEVMGEVSCASALWGWLGTAGQDETSVGFRCLL